MPTPAPLPDPAHAVIHAFTSGLGQAASQHPWTVTVLATAVLGALCPAARRILLTGPRDEQRRFTRTDKAILLALAGHRCEHHSWFTGRCAATEHLEADHVHPWSRGGWTHLRNGQILCRSHNRHKSAVIPWNRSLRTIAERRSTYYPTGGERTVVRRRPRPQRTVTSATSR